MDIAVLGGEEFVLGFRLAGIKRVYAVGKKDYEQQLLELLKDSTIGVLAVDSKDLNECRPDDPKEGPGEHRSGGRSGGRWRRRPSREGEESDWR